jgi:hypothetical protein
MSSTARNEPDIDLDRVAGKLTELRPGWTQRGLTIGELTWRDAAAAWPQPIVTDRNQVADPESLGITLTASNGNEGFLVIWRGGWADVGQLIYGKALHGAPDLRDEADCTALAESIASQLAAPPSSET